MIRYEYEYQSVECFCTQQTQSPNTALIWRQTMQTNTTTNRTDFYNAVQTTKTNARHSFTKMSRYIWILNEIVRSSSCVIIRRSVMQIA